MAEQAPGVKNKKLLLVSLVLGVLVVLIYNVHINRVRKAGEGNRVMLLKAPPGGLKAGRSVSLKELDKVWVSEDIAKALGSVIWIRKPEDFDSYKDWKLSQSVEENQLLRHDHYGIVETVSPTQRIAEGMEVCPLTIDPPLSKDEMEYIHPGARVSVIGEFGDGRSTKHYRIIEGVRVRTRTNRVIWVEVAPDVALMLADLTAGRTVRVHPIRPDADIENPGRINEEVKKFIGRPG